MKKTLSMIVICLLCFSMVPVLTLRAKADLDTNPPVTTLTIGDPKYVSTTTLVIPSTPFTLNATDDISKVNYTLYRVYNKTFSWGWVQHSSNFTFTPFLTGYKNGNYTIAYHSVDFANNTEPIKNENVTLCRSYDNLGDLTGNGEVDIYDITIICVAYDSKPGDPSWNPIVDFVPDNIINIFDVVTCLQYYNNKHK
jgi:hypothetical protein